MTKPLRVMIVEDEAVILMQLESLLEDAGHIVVGTAMSADEAIEQAHAIVPELLLIDVHLKDGTSGIDVAKAVRSIQGVNTVFLTANVNKLNQDMDGAIAAIAKPFSTASMTKSVEYLETCLKQPTELPALPAGMTLPPAIDDNQ